MKLSKTAWLSLGIGIFTIAFASLGMAYSGQARGQSGLRHELNLAQLRLDNYQSQQLSLQKKEAEIRLVQAESRLKAVKTALSPSTEGIEVSDTLFAIAEACDVEITEIGSSALASEKLEEVTCSVLPLTVQIEGDVPNLVDFVLKLPEEFPTGMVKSVEIIVPEEGEDRENPWANLRLFIYAYRGD